MNFTKCDLLVDEVDVDLNVLGPSHVDRTDIVTEDNHGGGKL
jgi:hypothetical protein